MIKNNHWNWKESYLLPWSWRHRRCPAGGPPLFSPWWPGGQWRPLHPPPPCRSAPASPRHTRWNRTVTTSSEDVGMTYCILIIIRQYENHTVNTLIHVLLIYLWENEKGIVPYDFMKRRYKLPLLLLFIICIQFKVTLHHFGTNNATHHSCYRQGAGTLLWTADCVVLQIIYLQNISISFNASCDVIIQWMYQKTLIKKQSSSLQVRFSSYSRMMLTPGLKDSRKRIYN